MNTQLLAREQARRGHDVAVFFRRSREGSGLEQWEETGGVQVWAAHTGVVSATGRFAATFRDNGMVGLFERVLAEQAPDLVHIQHLMGLPLSLVARLEERRIPFLVTLHDYWWVCANAQLLTNDREELCDGPEWWVNCGRCALARAGQERLGVLAPVLAPLFAYRNRGLRAVLESAAALTAPTGFTRELYARLAGMNEEAITFIPNGIPAGQPLRVTPPAPPPPLRVAYVGGIARQKGVHALVEAMQGFDPEQACLDLYGDTSAFPAYVEALQAPGRPNITFRGRISNEQLQDALARSHILVVPSIWYETSAIVIQEAFMAGLPVVASDLGALRERVNHGVDGLRVPPGDVDRLRGALGRFLEEPTLLERLRAGIRPVTTIEEQASKLLRLYDGILHS